MIPGMAEPSGFIMVGLASHGISVTTGYLLPPVPMVMPP